MVAPSHKVVEPVAEQHGYGVTDLFACFRLGVAKAIAVYPAETFIAAGGTVSCGDVGADQGTLETDERFLKPIVRRSCWFAPSTREEVIGFEGNNARSLLAAI